ncbi:hypothetical protein TNCV_2908271 [Trichonephila clavipes]|nr:hypothetical protein TNCV_2908271 [Trichonephila clavipes]
MQIEPGLVESLRFHQKCVLQFFKTMRLLRYILHLWVPHKTLTNQVTTAMAEIGLTSANNSVRNEDCVNVIQGSAGCMAVAPSCWK